MVFFCTNKKGLYERVSQSNDQTAVYEGEAFPLDFNLQDVTPTIELELNPEIINNEHEVCSSV